MRKFMILVVCCIFIPSFSQTLNPGSLWDDSVGNPYAERKAAKVGDILTVIISETSSASSSAQTKTSKSDSTRIDAGIGPILRALIPRWESGTEFESEGQGVTQRSGRLLARLTVVVKAILPSGNMVIEGTRYVQVNKETMRLVISGIVRPYDIRTDNTILSEFIAEASIRYEGKGTVGDRQRKGLINQLLDWLF